MITAPRLWKLSQCDESARVSEEQEERMRTRVLHSQELARDVRFCLVLPHETLSIPVMRRVLGDTLARLGLDEACISDLLLAVTEACTNVLRHAGPGRGTVVQLRKRTQWRDDAPFADLDGWALRDAG